ncbi:MAG: 16S rRNA (cytosine(967)-C(5))-methyltransferase RsmB [Pseudomonadales bacterium]
MTAPKDGHQDRLQAARGLASVLKDKRTLDQFERAQSLTPLATEMLYGSCRYYAPLSAALTPLLKRPLRRKDQDVWALMIVGAYQLLHMRVPDHAAINATVAAAKRLKKPWASGLVNAVLRGLQRQSPADGAAAVTALPAALINKIAEHYGAEAPALIEALSQRAPMALRINNSRQPPAAYGKRLGAQDIGYRRGAAAETLILAQAQPAESLPGYADGAVAVQDAGAQLAGLALGQLSKTEPANILDACAAPGGKLFHYIEQHPGTRASAVELSPGRLTHLQAEAQRLGHTQAQLLLGDATGKEWWDGERFDLILLDAPCSGSGTLRRHPDIALLRDFDDLAADIALQDALLANLVGMLAPQGSLLYATCSVLPEENDARIARLLAGPLADKLETIALDLPSGSATRFGWQLLPTDPDTDGFYYAGLKNLE